MNILMLFPHSHSGSCLGKVAYNDIITYLCKTYIGDCVYEGYSLKEALAIHCILLSETMRNRVEYTVMWSLPHRSLKVIWTTLTHSEQIY